jgi:hypothetical protein
MGQGDPGGQHQAGMTRTRWHAAPLGGKREIPKIDSTTECKVRRLPEGCGYFEGG